MTQNRWQAKLWHTPFSPILLFLALFPMLWYKPPSAPSGQKTQQQPSQNPLTPICLIQGKGYSSSYEGQTVFVQGLVTADFDQKRALFAVQQPNCDSDPATSDAVWVYLGTKANVVSSSDRVEVYGTVDEYFGRTEIVSTYDQVWRLSSQNPLPTAEELAPPRNKSQANRYFEAREGMLVSLASAVVIGPTDTYQDTWAVPASYGIWRLFHDDPLGTGGVMAIDERGLYKVPQPLKTGDEIQAIYGVLDESYEAYRLYLLTEPLVSESPAAPLPSTSPLPNAEAFRLATFNLANLYDTQDDPAVNDTVLSAPEYQRRLQKRALAIHQILGEPELIAVQEAENSTVLADLISRSEIQANYGVAWLQTPDPRGLDVALLYQQERFSVQRFEQEQGCTDLIDGLGPDGNQNVSYPENQITCDSDNDGVLDGNRLFSRPPLIIYLNRLSEEEGQNTDALIVVVCHWKSKVEDTPWELYTLERRRQEAAFTAGLIQRLRTQSPHNPIFLAGDLNDFPNSPPLQELQTSGLVNLTLAADAGTRYSYVYQGISQNPDYIFYESNKGWLLWKIEALHINADYPPDRWASEAASPIRSSDHDIWQAIFTPMRTQYLPLILMVKR
ncbi:MAG: endonuclease/exonuclease/phosphatase family protein [Chloroflexota bacterium]